MKLFTITMSPPFTVPVVLTTHVAVFAFVLGRSQPFVFDQCDRRYTNLTAQECVGKLILDTVANASEDPMNFFRMNEFGNDSGMLRMIKLEYDNDTINIDRHYEIEESRSSNSLWDQLLYAFKKLTNYSIDHGILLSLPQWSNKIAPVSVIDEDEMFNEGRGKHRTNKKYALLFPLLATFKFLVIKALLVPILVAVMLIKKMLVLGVMALPAVLTVLRFCRNNNNFGFGPGNLVTAGAVGPIGQAAAFAPLTADLSGDYSSYVQQQTGSQQNAAYKDYSKNLMDAMKATYRRR